MRMNDPFCADNVLNEKDRHAEREAQPMIINAKKFVSPHIVPFHDLNKKYFNSIDKGVCSGWFGLDSILGGFRMGEITVVTGDTGSGKTTFCLNLIYLLNKQDHPAWINSYEMHPNIVMRKMASHVLNKGMRLDAFAPEELKLYIEWSKQSNCYLNPFPSSSDLKTLSKQLESATFEYQVRFVLLDHLDYLHPVKQSDIHHLNIDEVMRSLHELAVEFQIHILLVVHPKQSVTTMQKIQLNDLKGSSGIKQYADNIIAIRRLDRGDEPNSDEVEISILKNRMFGIEDSFILKYNNKIDSYSG